ncbi:hypothetical protein JCM13591A_03740 [Microbacterium xylanilyticum]
MPQLRHRHVLVAQRLPGGIDQEEAGIHLPVTRTSGRAQIGHAVDLDGDGDGGLTPPIRRPWGDGAPADYGRKK